MSKNTSTVAALTTAMPEVANAPPLRRVSVRHGTRHPFNDDQLGQLRCALGEAKTAALLRLFAQELAVRPAVIRAAIGRSDLAAAASEAHSLKGAALSMGGQAVGEAAAALEHLLATGSGGARGLHRALRDLDRAVATTLAAFPRTFADNPQCAA